MIYWFTGQPGSGKSTLASALKGRLQARGHAVVHLDGEEMRDITGNTDYGASGRIANIKAGQRLAAKLAGEGIIVVASFVSPYRAIREEFKKHSKVIEIYVHTSAIRGREKYFVKDYEPPLESFVDMNTTSSSVEACVDKIAAISPF